MYERRIYFELNQKKKNRKKINVLETLPKKGFIVSVSLATEKGFGGLLLKSKLTFWSTWQTYVWSQTILPCYLST